MTIDKARAEEIAMDFLSRRMKRDLPPGHAHQKSPEEWRVIFTVGDPREMEPHIRVVLVDAATGETRLFPMI